MSMAIWWVAGVVAVLLAVLPRCGYSGTSEHKITSAVGIILIICLILVLLGRI
jgi:hypothetical protein